MRPPPPPPRQPTLLEQTVTALALDQHARTQLLHQAAALNIHHDDPAITLLGVREAIKQDTTILRHLLERNRVLLDRNINRNYSKLPFTVWIISSFLTLAFIAALAAGQYINSCSVSSDTNLEALAKNAALFSFVGITLSSFIGIAVHFLFCRHRQDEPRQTVSVSKLPKR